MTENLVYLSIGSNIEPYSNFSRVMTILGQYFKILAISSVKSTKSIGIPDQPDFLNAVALVSTTLDKQTVNSNLKEIEKLMGRDHSAPKFGPRVIDLDIVIWNDKVVDDDYYTREFIRDAVNELKSV